jgi:hypothetical protein
VEQWVWVIVIVYKVKIDHGTAEHGGKSVESYASMQSKHKAFIFTMNSAPNDTLDTERAT